MRSPAGFSLPSNLSSHRFVGLRGHAYPDISAMPPHSYAPTNMEILEKLPDLELKSFPVDLDESPSTVVSTLPPTPMPPAQANSFECHISDFDADRDAVPYPAAPVMKDYDSFTEGTGKGSFDYLDEAEEYGELVCHPETSPDALGLRLAADPSLRRDINIWLQGVPTTVSAPTMGITDLPDDPADVAALETAESLLDGISLGSGELDDTIADDRQLSTCNLPINARAMAMTPRVMKRARSRSPNSQASRRIRRPRSRSLSSLSFYTDHANLPPWRTENAHNSYLSPFD